MSFIENEMIFKYSSQEFESFKSSLQDFLHETIHVSSLNQDKKNLIHVLLEALKEENVEKIKALDNENLMFNEWSGFNEFLNNNILSNTNLILYKFFTKDPTQYSVEATIEALFLALYADVYEGSLLITDSRHKEFFEKILNGLNYYASTISEENFKVLTYLWIDIPRNVFLNHLDQHLDKEVIETVRNFKENEEFLEKQKLLNNKAKEDIKKIQLSLQEQKSEYNFVGLSNGFRTLRKQKKKELNWQNGAYYGLMTIIVLLIISKSVWSANYLISNNFDSPIFIIITISTVLFLFILLYFFRISLVNIRSIKSQILQIDLRLTLCQFIHNYDSDTKELREGMKESFERFESVIFAPIVATEDQMPSTFDGLEQLTGLLSSFNRSSK